MKFHIKSKKDGRAKTLLSLKIDDTGLISEFKIVLPMKQEHFLKLINTVFENEISKTGRTDISNTLYAVRVAVNTNEDNDIIFQNSSLWNKIYEKRTGFKYAKFTEKELQVLKTQKVTPQEIHDFFECSEWFAKQKTVLKFFANIQEVRDWAVRQKSEQPETTQFPNYYDAKLENKLTAQELVNYRSHLRKLGYMPKYSDYSKKLIGWEKVTQNQI
ncbi:hypothetical protein V9L05_20465 [Bernardetia sp. Wsw4-3y2]|uniref:hypothetical protein n=1 Tax=Bernardetia sp. Wsw4-3y2 TaxID=3127471 RepID=UPI0030CE4E90